MMMTIRSHDQFNTTIYGLDDRYRGIYNERRVILMNQGDMKRQTKSEDVVDLYNYHDGIERVAHKFIVVSYPIPERLYGHLFSRNKCTGADQQRGRKKQYATSKQVVIKVRKVSQ